MNKTAASFLTVSFSGKGLPGSRYARGENNVRISKQISQGISNAKEKFPF
jgi:hypothetical protein